MMVPPELPGRPGSWTIPGPCPAGCPFPPEGKGCAHALHPAQEMDRGIKDAQQSQNRSLGAV